MKSVFSVLVGYLVFGVSSVLLFLLSGVDPKLPPELGFRIWSTIYGIVFAFLGGYVAALIAGTKELAHAAGVAFILASIATVSLIAQPTGASLWSQIAALGFMVPAVLVGGIVRARQVKNRS